MSRVAVLGTGTMGAGMVRSLLREGHRVTAWNRTAARAEPLAADGATVADDPVAAVEGAEVVVLMLFDLDATEDVLGRVAPALGPDVVVLQTATVGLEGTARLATLAREHGVRLVDAPVLGTKGPAEHGTLVPLVAGDPADVEAATGVLDAIGGRTVVAGTELGRGTALKLACNAWVATVTAGLGQSIELTRALGLDPALFLSAIEGSAVSVPYAGLKGPGMVEGSFEPSFALDGLRKDLDLIDAAATDRGVPVVLLDALREAYATAAAAGHGDDDVAAVVTSFAAA